MSRNLGHKKDPYDYGCPLRRDTAWVPEALWLLNTDLKDGTLVTAPGTKTIPQRVCKVLEVGSQEAAGNEVRVVWG